MKESKGLDGMSDEKLAEFFRHQFNQCVPAWGELNRRGYTVEPRVLTGLFMTSRTGVIDQLSVSVEIQKSVDI